ncbi:MAG: NAD-glutamate dehydrogenase domain-containing protein [Pseudomonadota bacterium]
MASSSHQKKRTVQDVKEKNMSADRKSIPVFSWDERLKQVLTAAYGDSKGRELACAYGNAFSVSYHESVDIENTVHDVRHLEALLHSDDSIHVDFYRLHDAPAGEVRLKIYHKDSPVPLSDILPVLENMGLRCLFGMPYEARPQGSDRGIWMHDFTLQGAEGIKIDVVRKNLEETFLQVWHGRAENDGINQLVLRADLTCREATILRTYSGFMRQAKFPFSRTYVEQVLGMYPQIARELVGLFRDMHDPKLKTPAEQRGKAGSAKIAEMLQAVQKMDHDRILRNFKTLIEKTLRTSFFQTDENGQPKSYLAVKLDSKNIPGLPLPRPHVEVFVYSTRTEAIHLRGGEIARGGIRWSDRHDDFRTEVLGLMKSQMVKNTVIVPVGAKGGFVVKQPPKTGGREAYQQEGIECYKILVQALLDITDNNVKGKVVRPKDVVCHDGIDPYLVVAADKGTATFSNIANSLSLKAGFWLQDAFASGGSTGYDHKEVGITARGGWESVKRHFREMGRDIQKEPFTAAGVGDMAGDVFGNAMQLSKKIQLLGAFNHVHIFCDPAPDIEKSFAERERLFKAKGGWDAYDKTKLSPGGMVYERSAKFLKLTPQIKKGFGLAGDQVTPDDLMNAILKADVDLMWLGGIGTFVKSSRQSHADVDDKSNDAIRVDAGEIRAKVIGEGANLGLTQLARVEYARCGGRINTDFIDNSGGVDCSDHEVNIKILFTDVMAKGLLTLPQRNKLMKQMTDDVAALVLRDNYQQSQSLSFLLFRAREQLGLHADFIRDLEKSGITSRRLEGLPDDETLARLMRDGKGLTRPELSVLLAYAKMTLFTSLMKSDLPDDPAMEGLLFDYFPKALHKYDAEIRNHKLKRGIIATQIVNIMVNRMGPVFVRSRMHKTGASVEEVVRAFMIATEAFRVRDVWKRIEDLDNKAPHSVQMTALYETSQVIKRAVTWFLRFGGGHLKVDEEIAVFRQGIDLLKEGLEQAVPEGIGKMLRKNGMKFSEKGMPEKIAEEVAAMILLSSANDIIAISRKTKGDVKSIASAYFETGEKLSFDWLRQQVSQIVPENDWQARVISGLTDDFYIQQAVLTSAILQAVKKPAQKGAEGRMKLVNEWFDGHQEMVGKIAQLVSDLSLEQKTGLEMLMLASQRIGQMVYQVK